MENIQVKAEMPLVETPNMEIRSFIPYKDYYVYGNTKVELIDLDENGKEIPYKLDMKDIFVEELYTYAIYLNIIDRHLYFQKDIISTDFEETSEYATDEYKSYISNITFKTKIKDFVESGKLAVILTEPNIIRVKVLEVNVETPEVKKPYDQIMYLLKIVEYKDIQKFK